MITAIRTRTRAALAVAAISGLALTLAAAMAWGAAGETVLVSGPNGTTADGVSVGDQIPSISADGRYVAFVRDAGDTSTAIYLRDMAGGTTPVDVPSGTTSAGLGFNAGSPSLSSDGRYLAFASEDPAISTEDKDFTTTLAGDTFPLRDVFVYDRMTGGIALVSRRSGTKGAAANNDSNLPAISANGRYVAFGTEATNLTPGLFGGLYVRDLRKKTTVLVGRQSGAHGKALRGGFNPSISSDGSVVAFVTILGRPRTTPEIVVRDRGSNRTFVASRADGKRGAIAAGDCSDPVISANGRYVAFASKAKNLSRADGKGVEDIFVRDLKKNRTILVSRGQGSHGAAAGGDSSKPSISSDGRYVAFESYANNLGPADNGSVPDVFVRDLRSGHVSLVSRDSSGAAANAPSHDPAIAGKGRYVAFDSSGSNLSPADTVRTESVFRYQLLP